MSEVETCTPAVEQKINASFDELEVALMRIQKSMNNLKDPALVQLVLKRTSWLSNRLLSVANDGSKKMNMLKTEGN